MLSSATHALWVGQPKTQVPIASEDGQLDEEQM